MTIQMIQSATAPKPVGPYSQATVVNGLMFVSGIIPINPDTNKLELFNGDPVKQTQRVMITFKNFLESQNLNFSHVVKTTLFIKNMDDFQKINQVYGEYFTDHKPARACVEVSRLPKDVQVEIEAIVWKG